MSTLLMTGTIDSGYFGNSATKVTDTEERKKQYYETIEKYIKYSNFDNIVFAENSNYLFDYEKFEKMATYYGKKFEYLKVTSDLEKAMMCGKSYGEAHLISMAVKKSKFIRSEKAFYKVTGRVFVKNINSFVNDKNECQFITHNIYESCLTVFFKMSIDVFEECLMGAEKLCYEYDGKSFIERIYYQKLKDKEINRFKVYPDLSGIVGGSGESYDRSPKTLFIKNCLLKLGYYNYGKKSLINWKVIEKIEVFVARIFR